MKKKLISIISCERGTTLVEVIVAFVLLTMLLGVSSYVLLAYSGVYMRVNGLSRASSVMQTLNEEIYGQLYLASGTVYISDSNTRVSFTNSDNLNVEIYMLGGRLTVHYKEVADPDTGEVILPASDWFYPDSAYMKNNLTELNFYPLDGTNIIKVCLTLRNDITGKEYRGEKYVECYNIESHFLTLSGDSFPDNDG